MRLFTDDKVGCFLDAVQHAVENRRGSETKVLQLTLRVSPFTADLASTICADGIKAAIFSLTSGEPKPGIRRLDFEVGMLGRQLLTCYATPDTELPSIAFDQVKVTSVRARMPKDGTQFDLLFKCSFGPVGKAELEYVQQLLLNQAFITFTESEQMLDFEEDQDDTSDADEKARRKALPDHEWDDDGTGSGEPTDEDDEPSRATKDAKRSVGVNRPLHSHASKKKTGRRGARA